MRRCVASRQGTAAIEYALLLGLLALLATGALREMQSALATLESTEQALSGGLQGGMAKHVAGMDSDHKPCTADQFNLGRTWSANCNARRDGSGGGT